jgi:rhamnosyltransferase
MIGAGIVTYNPEMSDLEENLPKVVRQISQVVIVDNNSSNISQIRRLVSGFSTISLIENRDNKGIATGLNQIFEYARRKDWDWVLTLDDDSIVPFNLISSFEKVLTKSSDNQRIGIVCPKLIDKITRRPIENRAFKFGGITCITSGSLTNVDAWESAGGFFEWLFIDSVDYDFCLKLDSLGFQIVEAEDVVMQHSIGAPARHKIAETVFGYRSYSSFRRYFQERNGVYMRFRYCHTSISVEFLRHIKHIALSLLFDSDRAANFRSLSKGFRDGIRYTHQLG